MLCKVVFDEIFFRTYYFSLNIVLIIRIETLTKA